MKELVFIDVDAIRARARTTPIRETMLRHMDILDSLADQLPESDARTDFWDELADLRAFIESEVPSAMLPRG